jgi:hypothetical protein
MKDTHELAAEDFKDRVGQSFLINNQPVTLAEVETKEGASQKLRTQVSLTFRSEGELGVEDGQAPFFHPELGEHVLLVHRIVDPDGPAYQIILA